MLLLSSCCCCVNRQERRSFCHTGIRSRHWRSARASERASTAASAAYESVWRPALWFAADHALLRLMCVIVHVRACVRASWHGLVGVQAGLQPDSLSESAAVPRCQRCTRRFASAARIRVRAGWTFADIRGQEGGEQAVNTRRDPASSCRRRPSPPLPLPARVLFIARTNLCNCCSAD